MHTQTITYNKENISDELLKNWILENLPDYPLKISNKAQALEFAKEKNIPKCFLFSDRKKTPPIYQALAGQFHNKLRFAFISSSQPGAEELMEMMEIEHLPTIVIQESFTTDWASSLKYYEGD